MSSELGLNSIDGAGEADVATLSATVDKAAKGYKPFGPVLAEAVKERTRKLFGAAGVKAGHIAGRVTGTWQLGPGWAQHVTAEIVLGTREGASTRDGDLATLPLDAPTNAAGVDALIDAAVAAVAAREGIAVSLPSAGGASGGGIVDSAALDAYAASVTGEDGVLAKAARTILSELGLNAPAPTGEDSSDDARVIDAVAAELGSGWVDLVEPRFDAARAVLLDDRWASAREDVARYVAEGTLAEGASFVGTGRAVAEQASYWANRLRAEGDHDRAARLEQIAADAMSVHRGPALRERRRRGHRHDPRLHRRRGRGRPARRWRDGHRDLLVDLRIAPGFRQGALPHACRWRREAVAGSRQPGLLPRRGRARGVDRHRADQVRGRRRQGDQGSPGPDAVLPVRRSSRFRHAGRRGPGLWRTRCACCCGASSVLSPACARSVPTRTPTTACTSCCPVPRTAASSVATARTPRRRPPSTPSRPAGRPSRSGARVSRSLTRVSDGCVAPASWAATIRWSPPSSPRAFAPGRPRKWPSSCSTCRALRFAHRLPPPRWTPT